MLLQCTAKLRQAGIERGANSGDCDRRAARAGACGDSGIPDCAAAEARVGRTWGGFRCANDDLYPFFSNLSDVSLFTSSQGISASNAQAKMAY